MKTSVDRNLGHDSPLELYNKSINYCYIYSTSCIISRLKIYFLNLSWAATISMGGSNKIRGTRKFPSKNSPKFTARIYNKNINYCYIYSTLCKFYRLKIWFPDPEILLLKNCNELSTSRCINYSHTELDKGNILSVLVFSLICFLWQYLKGKMTIYLKPRRTKYFPSRFMFGIDALDIVLVHLILLQ